MGKLVMLRHGQSEWNKRDLFTGWVDIPLSKEGIQEAFEAGKKIAHISFDLIYISDLSRAQTTAFLAMSMHNEGKVPRLLHGLQKEHHQWDTIYSDETQATCIPMISAWQLNERMYGELQGLNKTETRRRFGDEQVLRWRRSYDVAPPQGESLKMTAARTIPYFKETILPELEKDRHILIVAHGNSLRAICMYLDGLSEEEVVKLEIPTGDPFVYVYENKRFRKGSL
ncbi:MAG: 2,3-bisphosphoglycerate-dependent phosphoglycerate mutase [Simkania sp.]|nr:2,3-bisphosphoglycerate-dependent phosphoglycerate mutase [Simkania sp.]